MCSRDFPRATPHATVSAGGGLVADHPTTEAVRAAGAAAPVDAASADAWQGARERFARLPGRGDPGRTEAAARHPDDLRRIADLPGNEREPGDARHAWRLRLRDLLEDHPDAAVEPRSAIAGLPPAGASLRRHEPSGEPRAGPRHRARGPERRPDGPPHATSTVGRLRRVRPRPYGSLGRPPAGIRRGTAGTWGV
ncbi:hypothetical protein C6Y14_01005 [Streptomyces dioscori]|uniref:Uncharacterized protein n=1 Tax=Streptomyces dioscori TaxID=2109333 RepID=A0A2P8QER1_9ACTN|nr:hypothetical protein C6Y14_01005 [Streptomyces dioscori]